MYTALLVLLLLPSGEGPSNREGVGGLRMEIDTAGASTAPAAQLPGGIAIHGLLKTGWNGGASAPSSFRVAAAELTVSGEVRPGATWLIKVDAAKALSLNSDLTTVADSTVVTGTSVSQRSRILQDAFLTLDVGTAGRLRAGQWKLPLGLEHGYGPGRLPTLTRARFISDTRRGGLGVVRDVGVSFMAAPGGRLGWEFGVFNGMGEGMNAGATGARKTASGRLTGSHPAVPGLTLGLTGAQDVHGEDHEVERRVLGADLRWARDGWSVAGEWVGIRSGAVDRLGWYVHGDRALEMGIRPFFRYEEWDPDLESNATPGSARETRVTAGISRTFAGDELKLEAALWRNTFDGPGAGATGLNVNLQLMW